MRRSLVLAILATLFSSAAARAQSANQAAIVGTVTDRSGAVAPGASVTAANAATGVSRAAVSNELGDFRIDFLAPGAYKVQAELRGFKRVDVEGVTLRVGQLLRINLRLVDDITIPTVNELFIHTQPAHLQKLMGEPLDGEARNAARARYLRTKLREAGAHPN